MITKDDYKKALLAQDAVNLVAVLRSFHKVTKKIMEMTQSTEEVWEHPIVVLYASKVASLTRCGELPVFSEAYEKVLLLSEV
jgi:hypothetical protein